MAKIEVVPHYEFTAIAAADFEERAADRLFRVPQDHVLVALGCKGCENRVCLDVNASGWDVKSAVTGIETALDGLGLPGQVVSHRSGKTIKASCAQNGECGEDIDIGLAMLKEEAQLRPKPEPAIYRSRYDDRFDF